MFKSILTKSSVRCFSASPIGRDMSKMSLIGTIGSELTQQETSQGKKYVKYAMAVNSKQKSGSTSWFNIAVFNESQINYMTQYLGKGAKIYVEADALNTSFEKEGVRSYSLMLFQNNFETLRYPKKAEENEQSA